MSLNQKTLSFLNLTRVVCHSRMLFRHFRLTCNCCKMQNSSPQCQNNCTWPYTNSHPHLCILTYLRFVSQSMNHHVVLACIRYQVSLLLLYINWSLFMVLNLKILFRNLYEYDNKLLLLVLHQMLMTAIKRVGKKSKEVDGNMPIKNCKTFCWCSLRNVVSLIKI